MNLTESITYNTRRVDPGQLRLFIDWLDSREVVYVHDFSENVIEIFNEQDLSRSDEKEFLTYIDRLGFRKIWENSITTLSNTVGLGAVNPPSPGSHTGGQPESSNIGRGSGDRFDNGSAEDDEDEEDNKKKKHKKKHKKHESLVFSEIINKI